MKIKTEQVDSSTLDSIEFDLVLVSSGFESRGRYLMSQHPLLQSKTKIVVGFNNFRNDSIRIYNDSLFEKFGFTFIIGSGNESAFVLAMLENLFSKVSSSQLTVLIDYSCMTRVWYAEILRYFSMIQNSVKVELYFSYTVSQYLPPPDNPPLNKFTEPLDGFYSISVPIKPTALLIGLGYVSSRAFGLAEYFDVQPYLFINDSSFNEEFHNEVIKQNSDLIKYVSEDKLFYYPLDNLTYTETLINHICVDLLNDYRVILAPCGPKPFTLLSLITSLRLNNVDVWRISAGENESPLDKKANGTILVLKCSIQNNEC